MSDLWSAGLIADRDYIIIYHARTRIFGKVRDVGHRDTG